MTNKCPICDKNHDKNDNDNDDARMEQLTDAASQIISQLSGNGFTPSDVM